MGRDTEGRDRPAHFLVASAACGRDDVSSNEHTAKKRNIKCDEHILYGL